MRQSRLRLRFAVIVAIGVLLTITASTAWGQDRCQPFRGTINASLVPTSLTTFVWVGEISFTIGSSLPLHGTTETVNTGVKRGGPGSTDPVLIGTEDTTVVLDKGGRGSFVLVTRFVSGQQDRLLTDGVGWIKETGTIVPAPGEVGKFQNVYGHYTLRGIAGPNVPHAAGGLMGWTGEYHGNICGVD